LIISFGRFTLPQASCLLDRGLGVVSQKRRNFQAYVTVAAIRFRIDGLEDVARIPNVAERNHFKHAIGIELLRLGRVQDVRVEVAACDGFLEDRRIGGHSAQAIVIDVFLQLPAGEQVSANVIHPG